MKVRDMDVATNVLKKSRNLVLKIRRQKEKTWEFSGFRVSSAPHIHSGSSVGGIMWTVFVALLPAWMFGIMYNVATSSMEDSKFVFRLDQMRFWLPILNSLICIGTCIIVDGFGQNKFGRSVRFDGSAAVTGLLIVMSLPPYVPLFVSFWTSVFAILFGKLIFGGLGNNLFNPAMFGRVFAMFAFPDVFSDSVFYAMNVARDVVSSATPLVEQNLMYSVWVLFFGLVPGCLGETSSFALLLGSFFLFRQRIVRWEIPLSYLGIGCVLVLFEFRKFSMQIMFLEVCRYMFSGGLILGALYVATDMVTRPLFRTAQLVLGGFLAIVTYWIRKHGVYPEGVAFAILLGNSILPFLDCLRIRRVYG